MRVLYTHYLDDDEHPAARMVAAVADQLRELGHEVRVRASRPGSSRQSSPLAATPRRASWLRGRAWFAKALLRDRDCASGDARAIAEFAPDVSLARHDAYRSSAALAATRAGVPLVTYADAPVAHEVRRFGERTRWHPPRLVEAIERGTLAASRRILTVSGPAAEILGAYRTGVPIDVIPNGVHPERFPASDPINRRDRRAALGLSAPIVVAFAGTFKPFHGIDKLRALMLSTEGRADVQWLLIGDGPGRAELESAVSGRVAATFLGRRPSEEVGAILSLADIAVAPHAMDRGPFYFCPLKLLEYAAAGCAILAGRQGDIASLLDDGRAARLLDSDATDDWVRGLHELLDDPRAGRAMGLAAREFVLSNRTWRQTAEGVSRALGRAVGRDRRAPTEHVVACVGIVT